MAHKPEVEARVREIRRQTRRRFNTEEKMRIVLEGPEGEGILAEPCRREGISPNPCDSWSQEFLEAGKRRPLGDSDPCFISKELGAGLEAHPIAHTRSKSDHPTTQGKIERYHRTLKNVLMLQNHGLPGALKREIARFVDDYNHERVHESLRSLTPADVCRGREREIESAREKLGR